MEISVEGIPNVYNVYSRWLMGMEWSILCSHIVKSFWGFKL